MRGGFRKLLDRWRLTFIGVPLLTTAALLVDWRYGAFVFVVSLLALAFCDSMVASERRADSSADDPLNRV
jgi:hypothetical protein